MLDKIGADIKAAREAAGLSQEALADVMGYLGRDAMSKMERGALNISLVKYLELVRFLSDFMPPDHPAVALESYYTPTRRRRAK